MKLRIPELSLVILIGPAGSGKSTFAKRHFQPSEILSSDFCRYLVSDDENDQSATGDAFSVLRFIASKRLAAGRLTVVDATNVQRKARKPLLGLARKFYVPAAAIVLNLPESICEARDRQRTYRNVGPQVIQTQAQSMKESLRQLERDGFRLVHTFDTPEEVDAVEIERQPLVSRRNFDHGPFDIIGDVHGCYDELTALLRLLRYTVGEGSAGAIQVTPPPGRKAVFLGDLVNFGPNTPAVLRLAISMVASGAALCVQGDHDLLLLRKLRGEELSPADGLGESLRLLAAEPAGFRDQAAAFLAGLVSHYMFDDAQLAVAHAGITESMQGREAKQIHSFALHGDEHWAAEYRGRPSVVYGHRPVQTPEWLNKTINIDTGCVFGGRLTALRYPEMELVSVPAGRTYYTR